MILIYHIFVVTLLFFGLIHISPPSYFRASIASRTRLSLKQQVSATSWKSTSGFYIFYLSRHSSVTKSCFALRISFFFSTVPTNTSKVVLNIFKSQGGICSQDFTSEYLSHKFKSPLLWNILEIQKRANLEFWSDFIDLYSLTMFIQNFK